MLLDIADMSKIRSDLLNTTSLGRLAVCAHSIISLTDSSSYLNSMLFLFAKISVSRVLFPKYQQLKIYLFLSILIQDGLFL